jgi:beta-glucanase (GH16 family)
MGIARMLPHLLLAAGVMTCACAPPRPGVGVEPSGRGALPAALSWSDDFEASRLDERKWVHYARAPEPGDSTAFDPAQAWLFGGDLVIRADRGPPGGCQPYVADAIFTFGRFAFTYGYVEARIKFPRGRGLTPTFFLYPEAQTANGYHEIDIAEFRGQSPFMVHQQIAFGADSDRIDWKTGSFYYRSPVDLTLAFHTYGVHWQPGRLTWYVDREPTYTQTAGVPSEPMYIILTFVVGSPYVGPPDRSTPFPSDLLVDYVRLYQ